MGPQVELLTPLPYWPGDEIHREDTKDGVDEKVQPDYPTGNGQTENRSKGRTGPPRIRVRHRHEPARKRALADGVVAERRDALPVLGDVEDNNDDGEEDA